MAQAERCDGFVRFVLMLNGTPAATGTGGNTGGFVGAGRDGEGDAVAPAPGDPMTIVAEPLDCPGVGDGVLVGVGAVDGAAVPEGDAEGAADGDGGGDADGEGPGVGESEGLADADSLGDSLGCGDGDEVAEGSGVVVGRAVADGSGSGDGEAAETGVAATSATVLTKMSTIAGERRRAIRMSLSTSDPCLTVVDPPSVGRSFQRRLEGNRGPRARLVDASLTDDAECGKFAGCRALPVRSSNGQYYVGRTTPVGSDSHHLRLGGHP